MLIAKLTAGGAAGMMEALVCHPLGTSSFPQIQIPILPPKWSMVGLIVD